MESVREETELEQQLNREIELRDLLQVQCSRPPFCSTTCPDGMMTGPTHRTRPRTPFPAHFA